MVAGGCGLVAGLLYRLNFLGLQRLRLSATVLDLFTSTIGRVLMGPGQPQQVFVTPTAAHLAAQQQQAVGGAMGGGFQQFGGRQAQMTQRGGGAAAAAARAVEPSPEALQQLVAMGFDEGSAAQALRQTGNNVEAAVQYLL